MIKIPYSIYSIEDKFELDEDLTELFESLTEPVEELDNFIPVEYEPSLSVFIQETELANKRRPEAYPKYWFVMQHHFRGKGVHIDFRRKMNSHLEGETILNAFPGQIKEEIDSLEKARKYDKILLKAGKFRMDMDPATNAVVLRKAKQPLVWLTISPNVFPPGSVGATRFEPGVFTLLDQGRFSLGVQKPYFKEFFLYGKIFKGRMIERLIGVKPEWKKPPKAKIQWQAKVGVNFEQTPYLLSPRGRKKADVVPPDGLSWLSTEWENKVKPEYRWWSMKLNRREKLRKINAAFNDLIDRKEIKAQKIEFKGERIDLRKTRFLLRRHYWFGPKVVRDLPVEHWDLVIDSGKGYLDEWYFEEDPLWEKEKILPGIYSTCTDKTPRGELNVKWLEFGGAIPPKGKKLVEVKVLEIGGVNERNETVYRIKKDSTEMDAFSVDKFKVGNSAWLGPRSYIYRASLSIGNPNLDIPAVMEKMDGGTVNVLESNPMFRSFQFGGQKLKGFWIMKREDPRSNIWLFQKSSLPGETRKSGTLYFRSTLGEKI